MRERIENSANIQRRLGRQHNRWTRFFLRAFFPLFEFFPKFAGQLRVNRVPRTSRDDVSFQRQAEQHDVADDIQNLVTHELVFEAQRLLRHDLIALDHDGTIETATLDLPQLHQLFNFFVDRECARSGDLRNVRVRIYIEREMLCVYAAIVSRRARNAQRVARKRNDRAITFRHGDRFIELEIFAILILLEWLALHDHIHERLRRTIKDRRFARVEFDQNVVDPAAVQGAEDMFNLIDFRVT